ncbi:phage terminase large subunit [Nonomuraea turcica]|uniref:phage terminase large subunit n=1 Tax=Nonomuraea sp. G32 TaxID=3067274 RepID=UPI00273B9DC1|nr:phage terminase large subunit [Nonomuraea sp. G32]MDP4501045.1 phage terminase large subunit [Nonomuraea sp. G32]
MAEIVVRYEPRGAVQDLFRSTDPEVLLSGAAGTGKSVGALMYIHLACLATPKVRALIVRKTHASLTASTLVTFREKVAKEALAAGILHFYGGSAQEPASYRYTNGSVIVVGGLDRASRLLSTEFDLAFVDEAIEVTDEDLDTIVSRLRNGVLTHQRLIMATNPGHPSHHLKQRADSGRCRMLYSKHEDNPPLYQNGEWTEYGRTYLARLDSLSGARYQRMRWGKWVSAEGLVYDGFDPAVHVVDRFEIPGSWSRWWSIDFGFTNPFVCQFWAEDGDGRFYLYREIYITRRLVEDHAKTILSLVQRDGSWIEPHPRAVICDHDAEDRATLERHLGLPTSPARKSVRDGIQAVQARLRPAGDARPRLYLMRDSLVERDPELEEAKKPASTAEEFPAYVWAVRPGGVLKEEPVKSDDHGMDALRYLVAERDLIGTGSVRSPARAREGRPSGAAARYGRPVVGSSAQRVAR